MILGEWEVAAAEPGETPSGWRVATVPAWAPAREGDLDAFDWCFRTRFAAPPPAWNEEVVLCLDGLATIAEVRLNDVLILESASMFAAHALDVGALLREENHLAIRCRALAPRLAESRRPRARWRTLIAPGNLRFFRTAILGRAPGFAPGPPAVGPWRPVRLERPRGDVLEELSLQARVEGEDGVLRARATLRGAGEASPPRAAGIELTGPSGTHRAILEDGEAELRIRDVARWWPHTHGEPALHRVRVIADGEAVGAPRHVGFRTLTPGPPGHEVEVQGLSLHLNGVPVFARGAVWTPVPEAELRPTLERARDAGLNLIRVVGTATYESAAFHDLCDELGMLVWQDFMFANFDYPVADEGFRSAVGAEAREVLRAVGERPSTAVVCGGSEVEQQAAMWGAPLAEVRSELFADLLPRIVRESGTDAVWVPNAPCGGEVPFRTDRGVANYFGVGGYRRPLTDVRRAAVRFASECLALANVSDEPGLGPGAGVMRDAGADWDFADVRDFYLDLLYGAAASPERYEALSREVSGEVMAAVFGEWRRAGSACGGGIVLWLRDLAPGAGWGLLDSRGEPKAAFGHLARVLAPVAVWMTDEGQNGVAIHVANDTASPRSGRVRLALYRDLEHRVEEAVEPLELPPHSTLELRAEALLGRWVDVAYAFRFGAPGHDLVVASLENADGGGLISQAVLFPAGRPARAEAAAELGLRVETRAVEGGVEVKVATRRFAQGVRLAAPGFRPAEDAFPIEPGGERTVLLQGEGDFSGGVLSGANLAGSVRF